MENTVINEARNAVPDKTVLPYLIREPRVKTAAGKAVILLHGVGSNEQDLFSLAEQLPPDFYIISPRGPFTSGAGRYAWYQVDFSTGRPVYNKEQEAASREMIKRFMEQVQEKYQLQEIYIGGFSQGAIMSYSIGLLYPDKVAGVIALSGRLLEEIKPMVHKDAYLQRLKIFIAHGIQDGTLSIAYAREARAYLQTTGAPISYHEYGMSHQVNSEVVKNLADWLKKAK
ncbi:alpha/beta hydrolase [Sediminibacterium soli]|uniref:alpha/beta hydrolase n=1 Tax=Sediminibacterium soli TaxID=2698829 RepID=UPI00137A90E9|nr:alpha/beta fold hydrolase [Sediminibacterium soli]NCI47421.1 alpha/beta fold hydrolase [Sediminibacterium soli]